MRDENGIGTEIVDSAVKVHKVLGPGLLESVYESAMAFELTRRGLRVHRQRDIPVFFEEHLLDVGFRADLLINELVLIELKSVEHVTDLFRKVTRNYLHFGNWRLGYLINFNVTLIKDGIERIVNGLPNDPQWMAPRPPRSPRETF